MSITFFNEPFYTLSDFDRLFDEAFNARASVVPRAQMENVATRPMRPRYVSPLSLHSIPSPPSLRLVLTRRVRVQDGPA